MGRSVSEPYLFTSLPKWRAPWSEFVLSYGVQAIAIAIFVWVPVLHPEILDPPKRDYHAIELVPTPVPVNHAPQRQLPKPVLVAEIDPPPAALRLPAPAPQPKPKPVEDAPVPDVKIVPKKLDSLPPAPAPVIPRTVKTNVFSTGSSAPQTIERPAAKVQTGGFGDPNGVPAKLNTGKSPVNIAQAGGFDMPTGPGYGNGTGGANGARGVVASTGFGGGVAVERPSAPRGKVQQAGFGDADVPAPPTVQARPAAPTAITPAEIISKPTPIYTAEARAKHIEGEVLLEVVFGATGKIQVLRVIHGLGYGLDDAAVHAAQQIRFKPALQDGQPSDSTAVLHIIFQLA
ncbi:MAG: energy transducer TonB [Candidatus Sulfotelmatobacter sp.]